MSMRMAFRKREENNTGRMGAMSRASLVHGTNHTMNDTWYDVDSFLLDQAKEVLNKLVDGSIDDEIWGKIVVMERCKRVAKAYLRKTTVIVDGSEDEFDGKTLGFNHFENNDRDEHTNEIRSKIGDGVILKMDLQGNIKGMARGTIPVITQGWRGERNNCISDRLIRQQGRLNAGEEEKAYKMFDMKKFKYCLERELHDGIPDPKQLLLKTCVRVALVKDGNDMARTPCWFAIVNLVALDMLREKIPNIRKLVKADILSTSVPSTQSPNVNSAISQEALTHIIAAAVNQVNNGRTVNPAEIAQLASSLTFSTNLNETISKSIRNNDIPKRKHYHCSSSSLDSSGEDTTKAGRRWENNQKLYESFYDSGIEKTREKEKKKSGRNAPTSRPRLSDVVFTRSHSITSDYDSNREVFDSGSWSSTNSRGFKAGSTASSLVSETELGSTANEHGRVHPAEVVNTRNIHTDKYGKSIDDESDISVHSVVSNTDESSAPSHHRSTTEIHIGSSERSEQKTDEDEEEEMNESAEESCDTRSNSSGQVERLREASSRKSAVEEGIEQSMIDAHHQQMPNLNGSEPHRSHEPIYEKRGSTLEAQAHYEPGRQHRLPRYPPVRGTPTRNNGANTSTSSRKPFFNELRQVLHQRSGSPVRRGAPIGTIQEEGGRAPKPEFAKMGLNRSAEMGNGVHQKQHPAVQNDSAISANRQLLAGSSSECINNSTDHSNRDGTNLYGSISHYGPIPARGLRRTSTSIAHYAGQQQQQQLSHQHPQQTYRYRYPAQAIYQSNNSNQSILPSSTGTHVSCMAQSATTGAGQPVAGAVRCSNGPIPANPSAAHRITRTASLPWTGSHLPTQQSAMYKPHQYQRRNI